MVAKKKETAKEQPRESTVEFLASLAAVLVTGLFIITFIVQAFEIPSSSMENTLLIGDHVFVNRVQFSPPTKWTGPILPYRQIRRGDIVVFLSPAEPGLYVVKRIIGIPGDRIHLRDDLTPVGKGEVILESGTSANVQVDRHLPDAYRSDEYLRRGGPRGLLGDRDAAVGFVAADAEAFLEVEV